MRGKYKIIWMIAAVLMLMVILLGMLTYWRGQMILAMDSQEIYKQYSRHYVLIADEDDSTFWDHVYNGASAYGRECDVYIERIGSGLEVSYSKDELVKIAINSKVDGILIQGDESASQKEMIDKAVESKIPVVTLCNDNYGSGRQTFVGINNYNIGREYAREVIRIAGKETKNILFIGDSLYEGTAKNLVMNGFLDTIRNEGNHLTLDADMITVNSRDSFAIQETIRDIFLKRDVVPDMIICLNEINTISAYQALVDYNMVGQVRIIGYYMSDTILNAIDKGVITSTIVFDAEKMGQMAVEALKEYQDTGYVNDYLTLIPEVIDQNNIEEYLKNDPENE